MSAASTLKQSKLSFFKKPQSPAPAVAGSENAPVQSGSSSSSSGNAASKTKKSPRDHDSSDDDEMGAVPTARPPVKKRSAPKPDAAADSSDDDDFATKPPPSMKAPANDKAKTPPSMKSKVAASSGATAPKSGGSAKKSPSMKASGGASSSKRAKPAPRALPAPTPLLTELPPSARGATIYVWQLLRCLHSEFYKDVDQPLEAPTLDSLASMLLTSHADPTLVHGGALGNLHRALLRTLCGVEDTPLYHIDDARLVLPPPAGADADADAPSARPPMAEKGVSAADVHEREYAQRAPIDAGMVVRFRDASKALDELSWGEVLRRLIVLWEVDDEGELEAPLAALAVHLEHSEYESASTELKAGALHALCDRALLAVHDALSRRAEELEAAEKHMRKEAAAKKKARSDEEKDVKRVAKEKKARVAEAWAAVETCEKALDEAKLKVSESMLHGLNKDEAKAALEVAKADVAAAKAAHREAKSGSAAAAGASASKDAADAAGAGVIATSRQVSKAKAEAAEAKRAQEEAARRTAASAKRSAARMEAKAMRLHDALRILPLGTDRDGRRYFRVTEPHSDGDDDDDDESDEEDGDGVATRMASKDTDAPAPRILVECPDGVWGEVSDLSTLRLALGESHEPSDSALRHKLPTALEAGAAGGGAAGGGRAASRENPIPSAFSREGHAWLGARVRLVTTRDGYEWHDGRIIAWSSPAAAADEGGRTNEDSGDDVDDDAASGEVDTKSDATWLARYVDNDGATRHKQLDEAACNAAMTHAADAGVSMLRGFVLDADDEAASLDPTVNRKKKGSISDGRLAWREAVEAARTPAEFREQLGRLSERMFATRDGEIANETIDPTNAPVEHAWITTAIAQWRTRLSAAATVGQLALRLVELEALLLTKGNMRAGMAIKVWIERKGPKAGGGDVDPSKGGKGAAGSAKGGAKGGADGKWEHARVVAVWRNGTFRARVDETDKRDSRSKTTRMVELHTPGTKEGNAQMNKLWRMPERVRGQKRGAPAASASSSAAAGGGGRVARGAAQRARAAVVQHAKTLAADSDAEMDDDGSSDSADVSGSDDDDDDDDDAEDVRAPAIGESVEVLIKAEQPAGGTRSRGGAQPARKAARGEWVVAEVTRTFRGGSFEVTLPNAAPQKDDDDDDEEEEEEEPLPAKKFKCALEAHHREWRHVKA